MEILEALRLVIGGALVLFIPGLVWSFLFFNKDEIDWIERIALSFGLSIALVPLAVFFLNYVFNIGVNLLNVTVVIVVLILIPVVKFKFGDRIETLWAKRKES